MMEYCAYCGGTWPPPLATTFKKCPACGLEWRGAEVCPRCEGNILMGTGASWAIAERDQARDWCRMLVAHEKIYGIPQHPRDQESHRGDAE